MNFRNKGSVSEQTKGQSGTPNFEILYPACQTQVPTKEPPYVDPECEG